MKWVTRKNVGIDRMGCAWLIRRFIESDPQFAFIEEGEQPQKSQGEPFDIPGVRLSHHGGHCSFFTMLREYRIQDPVLEVIARIIDEADTVQEAHLQPAAPGLDLLCRGMRLISQSDEDALSRGGLIYDALYEQLKKDMGDEAGSTEEE